jgi:hypothetical protein
MEFKQIVSKVSFALEMAKNGQKGFAAALIAGIMGIVVGAAMLYVGLLVNVVIGSNIDDAIVSAGGSNATYLTTSANVNTAFTLLGISMIVGGAAVIIGTLMGFGRTQ